jgi:hypothetical protein
MYKDKRKYHFIYKTTNIITGRYYYGMHSTNNLEDGYLGSGHRLWYSIRKYGKENHKREIVEFHNSREELKQREKEIVDLNEIAKDDCMNLQPGGGGGFISEEHMRKCCNAGNDGFRKKLKEDREFANNWSKMIGERNRKLIQEGRFDNFIHSKHWTGRKHRSETIEKIKLSVKGKQIGEKNSQFGTQWIYNLKTNQNKKILKTDQIPNGWAKGRK